MFKKEIKNKFDDINEYTVLGEYNRTDEPIKMRHDKCGTIFFPKPNNFLQGTRCPKCMREKMIKKRTKDHEDFLLEVANINEKENENYMVLEEYKNNNTKIKFKHKKCGNIYEVTPDGFLRGNRCPECMKLKVAEANTKSSRDFIMEIKKLVGNKYQVIGEYINSKTPIKFKHKECGEVFYMRPSNFLKGQRCPICYVSSTEARIKEHLDNLEVDYEMQYKIDECKNKKPLPFDFAVFVGSELLILIEYDGRLHYEAIEHFGGKEALEYRQQNDEIKNNYCDNNGLELLRIPYWEKCNIEDIITNKINDVILNYHL